MGLLQLALDFFAGGATSTSADAAPVVGPPPVRGPSPGRPPRVRISRPLAPAPEALPNALQAGGGDAAALAASPFPQHPRANREALLGGQPIRYAFQRGRRRTIGFSVGPEGLTVRAPGWVPLHQIDAALTHKAEWIVRKLTDAHARRSRIAECQVVWGDGARFPYLGESVVVALCGVPGSARGKPAATLLPRPPDAPADAPRVLQIALAADAPATAVQAAAHAWLLAQARTHFAARLDHFAPLLDVRWTRLGLTNARTRWGSANSSGAIRLHWRLMHFRPEVVDYVVAHELAHLRHMDHSARFWSVVAQAVPNHAALRSELRHDSVPRWE